MWWITRWTLTQLMRSPFILRKKKKLEWNKSGAFSPRFLTKLSAVNFTNTMCLHLTLSKLRKKKRLIRWVRSSPAHLLPASLWESLECSRNFSSQNNHVRKKKEKRALFFFCLFVSKKIGVRTQWVKKKKEEEKNRSKWRHIIKSTTNGKASPFFFFFSLSFTSTKTANEK